GRSSHPPPFIGVVLELLNDFHIAAPRKIAGAQCAGPASGSGLCQIFIRAIGDGNMVSRRDLHAAAPAIFRNWTSRCSRAAAPYGRQPLACVPAPSRGHGGTRLRRRRFRYATPPLAFPTS